MTPRRQTGEGTYHQGGCFRPRRCSAAVTPPHPLRCRRRHQLSTCQTGCGGCPPAWECPAGGDAARGPWAAAPVPQREERGSRAWELPPLETPDPQLPPGHLPHHCLLPLQSRRPAVAPLPSPGHRPRRQMQSCACQHGLPSRKMVVRGSLLPLSRCCRQRRKAPPQPSLPLLLPLDRRQLAAAGSAAAARWARSRARERAREPARVVERGRA